MKHIFFWICILLSASNCTAQNSQDRRSIADTEFARRRSMIEIELTNVPDSVKMDLLFQDYFELYGL